MIQTIPQSRLDDDPKRARAVLFKVLRLVQDSWDFTNQEMARLLHVRPNTYGNWMGRKEVPYQKPPYLPETELIVTVLSIFRSLGAMFASPKDQVRWITSSHPDFRNDSPLKFAQESCENLYFLKAYLDYVRGRGA